VRSASELASRTPLARCRTVPQTAPDEREDPQVTARSIFSLAFEVPLVFPAACYHAVRIAEEGNVDDARLGTAISPDIG
jgi:hypothetical protein